MRPVQRDAWKRGRGVGLRKGTDTHTRKLKSKYFLFPGCPRDWPRGALEREKARTTIAGRVVLSLVTVIVSVVIAYRRARERHKRVN